MVRPCTVRNDSARFDPLLVGLELDAKTLVAHPQIPVGATQNRVRYYWLHFLSDYADVRRRAVVIAETVETQPVVELT